MRVVGISMWSVVNLKRGVEAKVQVLSKPTKPKGVSRPTFNVPLTLPSRLPLTSNSRSANSPGTNGRILSTFFGLEMLACKWPIKSPVTVNVAIQEFQLLPQARRRRQDRGAW